MLRGLYLLLLGGALVFLMTPYVLTSRALDEKGVVLQGRVYRKSESVRPYYSGWARDLEVTIEYPLPETRGVSFFGVRADTRQYDALHLHQPVEVRRLLHRDLPKVPLAEFWWQAGALPVVKLVGPAGTGSFNRIFDPAGMPGLKIAGGLAALLLFWRITRVSALGWAAAIGIAAGVGWLFILDFPRAMPQPQRAVRSAIGRVKSVGHVNRILSGQRSSGWVADQPIDVLGVEFVPEGRSEPVVAVDLIDRGSVPALKQGSTVAVRYEAESPRTAYVEGATRSFPGRNLRGAVRDGVLVVGVLIGFMLLAQWAGRAFNQRVRRRLPRSLPYLQRDGRD